MSGMRLLFVPLLLASFASAETKLEFRVSGKADSAPTLEQLKSKLTSSPDLLMT